MTTTMVVDVSVLVDALLPGPERRPAREALRGADTLAAPEHPGIEVLSVLRRMARRHGEKLAPQLEAARRTLIELRINAIPLVTLHERVWELRHALTVYDAAYVAAAEHLGAALLSADTAILNCPDRRCAVTAPGHRNERGNL